MHKTFLLSSKILTCTLSFLFFFTAIAHTNAQSAKKYDTAFVENLKRDALLAVGTKEKAVQEMVDMVFSFGELGFQEIETSKYITGILEKNGFTIERGISGIPTAWMAKWG